ncbi:MAG: rhamnan synthesis F family protein [Hasllibacter sp.]
MLRAIYRELIDLGRFAELQWSDLVHRRLDIARQKRGLRGYEGEIREVIEWLPPSGEGRLALFVYYEPDGVVSGSARRAVEAMRRAGWDIVVLCNHVLSEEQTGFLADRCHAALMRSNQGFDFGAYQDGVKWLRGRGGTVARVLFINDSVFFASRGLDGFFERLTGPEDAVASHENQSSREHYHLQSFAVSVSARVWESAPFRKFWANYVPVNNRTHAIEAGEKDLSLAVQASARSIAVIYDLGRLAKALEGEEFDAAHAVIRLPQPMREIAVKGAVDGTVGMGEVLEVISSTSPAHSGVWYLSRYLDCPTFKKDLYFRQRYALWELELMAADLMPPDEAQEFLSMIRRKGTAHRFFGAERRRYAIGAR